MEELVDMIAGDSSPSDVSDKIKEILFSKASEKINSVRPEVTTSMFNLEDEE
jgi:hypothetical protein